MWIAGLILLLIATGLLIGAQRHQKKVGALRETQIVDVDFLASLSKSLEEDHGESGSLVYYAGVKGRVRCDQPLTSEFGAVPCVYYKSSVVREYEETYYQSNNGQRERRTRRSSETMSSREETVPFQIEDTSGTVKIRPDKAKWVAQNVVNRFEPARTGGGGGFSIQVGQIKWDLSGGDNQTLGYRFRKTWYQLIRKF